MLNVKELSLDLGKRTSNQHVIIAQGDTRGTTIEATIYDHGTKLADTDLTAYFVMLLPDGEHYVRDAAGYDTGVITYTVNESYAAAVTGYTPVAYFELHDGNDSLVATTERFSVTVEQCAYDGLEPAESWDSEIAQLVIDGCNAVNAVEHALETLVDQEQSMLTGATATVDATTGTPSVTVTMGEPQEGGRSANFAFTGIKGEDGERGQQGADGYSPTVNISSTTDEHIVTITDAQGAHTYTVDTYADEEQARATAETTRSNAESTRATEWATIKAEAETATSDATAAASDATAAAAEARAASAATWLSGNVLFGELAEGVVLTADDVYAAPARDVDVYGASTQVTTTGKNLFDINGVSFATNAGDVTKTSTGVTVTANLASGWSYGAAMIEVSNVSSVTLSTVPSKSTPRIGLEGRYSDDTVAVTRSALASSVSVTLPSGVTKVRCVFYSRQTSSGAVGDTCTYNNIQLELGSTATSYEPYTGGKAAPSPDYPQEIKSVDDLTLHVCGKNLFDKDNGPRLNAYLMANTIIASSNSSNRCVVYISCAPNTTYTVSRKVVRTIERLQVAYTTELPAVGISVYGLRDAPTSQTIGADMSLTITTGADAKYLVVWAYWDGATEALNSLQIELGSTATDYAPYVGQSVQIPLGNNKGRSLPDGTCDTLTLSYIGPSEREGWGVFGKTLVQRVMETIIDGNHPILQVQNANYLRINLNAPVPENSAAMTDQLAWNSGGAATNTITIGANRTIFAWLSYSDFPTLADYKAHLAEHPMTLLFALVTPITHDLGTVELPILPNPLTAWADGGSAQPTMSMTYERDVNIALVMERDKAMAEIAPLETSPTKANHSVGTYLMYGGTLYKVTRAIASGEQITPGTNVTATTVAAELLALA